MIMDDDAGVRDLISSYLKSDKDQRWELLMTPDGETGLLSALEEMPEVILVDWEMPGKNGIEVLKELKAEMATRDIPVIVITGVMCEDEHLALALKNGAADFVRKPFSRLEVLSRIHSSYQIAKHAEEIRKQRDQIEELLKVEKELKKQLLEKKDRELLSAALQLNQKNDSLGDLKKRLEDLPNSRQLQAIIHSIEMNQRLDKHWEEVKLHFEEVHPNFFNKLVEQFPNMTQNELRLCVYIKMRISNKSIAQMLNLSMKGIESAKYRLKKRLNLSAEQDLNEFLFSY